MQRGREAKPAAHWHVYLSDLNNPHGSLDTYSARSDVELCLAQRQRWPADSQTETGRDHIDTVIYTNQAKIKWHTGEKLPAGRFNTMHNSNILQSDCLVKKMLVLSSVKPISLLSVMLTTNSASAQYFYIFTSKQQHCSAFHICIFHLQQMKGSYEHVGSMTRCSMKMKLIEVWRHNICYKGSHTDDQVTRKIPGYHSIIVIWWFLTDLLVQIS